MVTNTTIDRRELLKLSALATASSLMPVAIIGTASATPHAAASTGTCLTRISACDDCLRLALISKRMPNDFGRVLVRNWDVARIGYVQQDTLRLTALLKTPATEATEKKIAFALGGLAHVGVSQQLYPGESRLNERMIYHDAALLRYFSGGTINASTEDVADLLAAVDSRTYIRIHTFQPDVEQVDDWILRMVAWNDGKAELRERYAQAIAAPDTGKVRKYVEDENFYDPKDEIIQLAAALRRGDAESSINIRAAHSDAQTQSLYARALAAGYGNLLAAADIYNGQSNAPEFRK